MPLREIRRRPPFWQRHLFPIAFVLCLVATALPLWIGRYLPAVDWPQHMFLIGLLDALKDPNFAYADLFEEAPGLTYLTFYYGMHAISQILPLDRAFQVFLTLLFAVIPLTMLFLIRSLGRSKWLVLLTFPLLFTYNFYWGLFSFIASLPWTFLAVGFAIQLLEFPKRRPGWDEEEETKFSWKRREDVLALLGMAIGMVFVQLTHAASMAFLGLAIVLMTVLTPTNFSRLKHLCLAILPSAIVFAMWLFTSITRGHAPEKGKGPWQAKGELWELKTYVFTPAKQRLQSIPETMTGGFWDFADRPELYGWGAILIITLVLGLIFKGRTDDEGHSWFRSLSRRSFRPLALFALGLGFYFLIPTDVTGYMYMIHPRYLQVAALLLVPVIPFPKGKVFRVCVGLFTLLALTSGFHLAVLFHRYDQEAREFEPIVQAIPQGAKVMHLVTAPTGSTARLPTYLHFAALAAQRVQGIPSFSLARHDPFPVHYTPKGKATVPAPKSEWHPTKFDWNREAKWFDVYLVRTKVGQPKESAFGRDTKKVELMAESGPWSLWKKREAKSSKRRDHKSK